MKKIALIALSALTIVGAATAGSQAFSFGIPNGNSTEGTARRVNAEEEVDEHGIIITPDNGEHKFYTRAGTGYYYQNQSVNSTAQSGRVEIVETADGTVYVKDIISTYTTDTWVKGTIDNGVLSIPVNQPVAYNTNYSATLSVCWGSYDENNGFARLDTPNITFTIDGDVLTLQGSDENTFVGVYWDDYNQFSGYADYGTIWTLDPDYEPLPVYTITPPEGLQTETWYTIGEEDGESTFGEVNLGIDGSDVYIQGIFEEFPETWVKGTIDGTTVTFEGLQYQGLYSSTYKIYAVGATNDLENFTMTYDAIAGTFTANKYLLANASTEKIYYLHFFDSFIITKELVIDVPVPGAMGDSILAHVENFADVLSLKLTGKLNSDDIATLKNRLTSLYALDLSGLDWKNIPDEQFRDKSNLYKVILPANVETIGNRSFYQCYNLLPIEFPATLQSIGEYAFYRTYNIGDVVLPEGLTSISNYAFYESRLTSITFPSTLKAINYEAFCNCDYLNDITFNGQTSIDNTAFYDCDALVSVKFPETLQSIGSSAFSYSERLKNIEFNEGLTSIGDDCFYDCDAIESVTLPSSLQTLNGYDAFRDCNNLKQVTCKAIVPPYTNNGNITGKSGLDLYVPQLSVNVYKQTSGWDQFNIHGINVMPDNIIIQSDYKLNWPDSLSFDYKPNVILTDRSNSQYGSLTVNGNSTLSAGQFTIKYDPNIARNNSYRDAWGTYTHNRFAFASLVNNANVRADNITLEYWLRANSWEFVTIPFDVKVSDIRMAFEDTPFVIRKYDGEKRAAGQTSETWVDMTADSTLHAGQGYIWRSASTDPNNRNYTGFYLDALQTVNKNNIFANDNLEIPLAYYESEFAHNRSWNLIGNPYPCFYDIRAMQTSAPITVWDTYQNNYRAYSPQDDAYILNPGQAFFVQRPVDEESIIFLKEGRQTNLTVRDIEYNNSARVMAPRVPRSVFNVILSNGEQSDRTRFVINANAMTAYEQGRDASKFASLEHVSQLYTVEGGVHFAINERPLANGTVKLGMQIVKECTYTLKLDTKVDNEIWLIDSLTGEEILLSDNEEGYTFSSKAGTFDNRFMLRIGNGETTGIADIDHSTLNIEQSVFDLQGRRVNHAQKGVYIKNGRKTVVK